MPTKFPRKIAEHVLQGPVEIVLDAFCGMGGNTIQFALSPFCNRVVAVDSDLDAVECAKHNAKIYGVLDKIDFIVGDIFQLIRDGDPRIVADVVFMSPPWGGPGYRSFPVFDLETMEPYSMYSFPLSIYSVKIGYTHTDGVRLGKKRSFLVEQALKISPNVALYLPRTSDLNQLAGLVPSGQKAQGIHYCLRQRSKVC